MEGGNVPELEKLISLLGQYEATGRDPTADGIPPDLQVAVLHSSTIPHLHSPSSSSALMASRIHIAAGVKIALFSCWMNHVRLNFVPYLGVTDSIS